ncbi:proton channel OTOP2-like [Solea solea]|uniref:proton channel OTOP2-like n=1 Tax=Solea solea TaxID=90069 RepID=UPI00272A8EE5|nr:proton channel OTOP2-like [Solea solea]
MCLNTGPPCHCLTEGNPCEPCRLTAKDKEMEEVEVHLSNNISATSQASVTCEPDLNVSHTTAGSKTSRNWGWIVSVVIFINILLPGCALASGTAYNDIDIKTTDLQIFQIIIIILTSTWMIYYSIFAARNENAVVFKDSHAGPIWLRGGLVLFGLLSIIMDIFKIASYVGYLHCDSGVKVAFPVVQFVFLLVQTCFFWLHAKDCVQLQRNLTRCGLMLTLSTNLVVWMTAVTEESVHHTIIPDYESNTTKLSGRNMYISKASYGDSSCKCSHTSCSIFKAAYYYLYPFNIEYSLFASAMAYVMWKNVGRVVDDHPHHKFKLHPKDAFLGPVTGVLIVIAGLATFIAYEMEMANESKDDSVKDRAMMMHFAMNIVIVTTMSVATVIGCVTYRADHREHNSDKNPTRNLDVGLLVGASLGQFIISYFTIIAMIETGAKGYLNRLNLTWAILMVIQLGLQNLFLIEGLHREPYHELLPVTVVSNPYVLQPGKDVSGHEESNMDKKAGEVTAEHNAHGHTTEHKHKLSWKRRVLKEVCAFLLLGNVILWIMPAFGARPQFDHDAETEFFTFDIWAAVVNVALPFGIFYRMHSVASLFEVFLTS